METVERPEEMIARLSAENERLRQQLKPTPRVHGSATHRLRAIIAVILIVFGTLLAPVAVLALFTKAEVTNTDRFVATVEPLIRNAAFRGYLVDEVVTTVNTQVDFDALSADLFSGLATLDLPPRAQAALPLLQQPAAEGMRSLVRSTAERVVSSEAFAQVWGEALRVSHTQIQAALSGDQSAALVISENGELGIQLGPVIAEIKTQLVAQGFTLATRIPDIDRTIPIAQADALVQARTAYTLLDTLGFVLPWLSLALITAGVLVARKRARALIWAGLSLAAIMILLIGALAITRIFFVSALSPDPLPRDVAGAVFDSVAPFISASALAAALVGGGVAVVAYLAGPFRGARALRGFTRETAGGVRNSALNSGISTGGFGRFVYRARRTLHVLVAVISAAVILFVRPLTPSTIIWTAVIALLAILLIELLQLPPDTRQETDVETNTNTDIDTDATEEIVLVPVQEETTGRSDTD
ncbi:hypothetical protein [Cryobacterium sp. CG_9.6]|uniref:hypothetical protein n=1 Tax=Cryobacterium sp. CG_9.6 TaxID=2760710 RepID=UPI0024764583|nr:hypothetical protein [Cryobacterium sp. CG_9.6]MDH6238247.1 putative Tic20 family protein [Cryobacterium sp. CG_9.6]